MKLDAKALRYMSSEEFRVLTAVGRKADIVEYKNKVKSYAYRLKWAQKTTKLYLVHLLLKLLN